MCFLAMKGSSCGIHGGTASVITSSARESKKMSNDKKLCVGDVLLLISNNLNYTIYNNDKGQSRHVSIPIDSIFVVVNVTPSERGQNVDLMGSVELIPWRDNWSPIWNYFDKQ